MREVQISAAPAKGDPQTWIMIVDDHLSPADQAKDIYESFSEMAVAKGFRLDWSSFALCERWA